MTADEMYVEISRKNQTSCRLFDQISVSLPTTIKKFVGRFRELLVLGGLVPIPVVLIDDKSSDLSAWVNNISESGKGLLLQIFTINVEITLENLSAWCQLAEFTEEESIIRLAAHEARHCLQRRVKERISLRGVQWCENWLDTNFSDHFKHLGDLVYNPIYLQSYAAKLAGPEATSKAIRGHIMREHDAETIALACVACWRKTQDIRAVTQILHG